MIIIGIIVAILMFSLIILIHELGHFLAARKFGVKVEEFGMGIPPKAKEFFTDKKGTVFTLNWLPLGGFVRLKGENPHELENNNDPEALINKTYVQKSIILLGGVFMNFLLASVIFSVLFFIGVKPIGINSKIETDLDVKIMPTVEQAFESGLLIKGKGIVLHPVEGSLAEKSGIQQGDVLLQVGGKDIGTIEETMKIIQMNKGKTLTLSLLLKECIDSGSRCIRQLYITTGEDGKIGSYLSENVSVNEDFEYKYGILGSLKYGFLETYNQSLLTVKGLGILLKKIINPEKAEERAQAVKEMKGPIGIVDLVANSLEAGIVFIVIIGAIISINLGVFNLLPIPALDGGRWFIISINTLIQTLFGKKALTEKTENAIHVAFFLLLIALSIIIGYNDISQILDR